MPLPEGYKLREEDVIILHATVQRTPREGETSVYVEVDGRSSSIFIDIEEIKGLYTRHFEPGERVRLNSDPEPIGEVVATCDGAVWVKLAAGLGFETYLANDLAPFPTPAPVLDQDFIELEMGTLVAPPPAPAPETGDTTDVQF